MKYKILTVVLCWVILSISAAEEHHQTIKDKAMGAIRSLACFSCKANVGAFSYLYMNPVSIKGFEMSITFGCMIYTGNYKMCNDNAVAYTGAILNNFKK